MVVVVMLDERIWSSLYTSSRLPSRLFQLSSFLARRPFLARLSPLCLASATKSFLSIHPPTKETPCPHALFRILLPLYISTALYVICYTHFQPVTALILRSHVRHRK